MRILIIIFSGLLVLLNGCEKKLENKDRIVAKIDDFKITYDNFEEQFKKVHPGRLVSTASTEEKQAVLDDMIEQQLTLFEAYRLGYDRDEKVRQFIASKERVLAGDALRKREVDEQVITEELIVKYYRWLDKEFNLLRMKFVFTSEDENKKEKEELANQVYKKLQDGADFKKLAVKYSQHKTADKDSGDMRIVSCYNITEQLFEHVYNMSEGEFSKPFLINNAFYVLKVQKIFPKATGTFEEEKPGIINMLKEIYQGQISQQFNSFRKNIMEEYGHTLNLKNIAFFCKRTGTMKTKRDSTGLFNDQDKKLVLAKTDIEQTTIGHFFPLVFPYYWESLNQERLVKMLLTERNFRRLVNHKAMLLNMNELPEVREELTRWEIYYYKKFVLQKEVEDKIDVSDGVLLPIYEQQRHKLRFEEQRTAHEIFCKTQANIEKVYNLALKGYDFQELERKYQQYKGTRTNGIIGPFRKGLNGRLGENAFKMNLNDISKPFRYRGGYSIIKLLSIEPGRQKTYQEAKEELKAQYIDENKKGFISQWIDRVSENYDISKYDV